MSTGKSKKQPRRVGRPSGATEADVRAAILQTAERLFLRHGFERVSARQIAADAGTTPAMIHYYFGNKLGLFRAIFERVIEPVRTLLLSSGTSRGNPPHVADLMRLHMNTVAANPWIANVMLNEVLIERGRFRGTFMREIAGPQLELLVGLIEQGRQAGRYRPDIDPRLTALSLLSLCVFPFISRAVTAPLLQIELEGEGLRRLIDHTTRLFLIGIQSETVMQPQERTA